MAAEADIPLEVINADGGMVKNAFLMQFVADITGLAVRTSTLPELSALGAVLSGALGMGVYHSLDDLDRLPHSFVDYRPSMPSDLVEKNYSGWKAAVKRVL